VTTDHGDTTPKSRSGSTVSAKLTKLTRPLHTE
jgi:hypothetical protein